MREIYNRVEDSDIISIEVNVDAEDVKDTHPWLFSVFIKSGDISENSESFDEFLEIKESIIIALEHENRAIYVGTRVNDGWSELYFYAQDSKKLDAIVTNMLRDSGYKHESNVVRDTKWGFFTSQLFPTELEFHHIQSDKIIFLLQEEGDSVTVPRVVEHYASFETASQKDRFIQNTLEKGFEFKDDISSEEFDYGAALTKVHAVTNEEVKSVVEEFFELVKKEHGFYEGWSTILIDSDEYTKEEE